MRESTVANLLFTLTAHENEDSLICVIKSIFKAYADSYVIIHLSESWQCDKDKLTNISERVFINPTRYPIVNKFSGKTGIHVSNIEYFNSLNIEYDFTIFCASNELFIKPIDIEYIETHEYGSDWLALSEDKQWFSRYPHPDKSFVYNQLNKVVEIHSINKRNGNFGGRHEGMFLKKWISDELVNQYRDKIGHSINRCRCDEESLLHTIIYNIVDPTPTEGLCLFLGFDHMVEIKKKTSLKWESLHNLIDGNLDMYHVDLFSKVNNSPKNSVKGIDRDDVDELQKIVDKL